MSRYFIEDFRFTTVAEVEHYSPADLIRKPHMSGFEFSQLLDQLDGQVISNNQTKNFSRFLVSAPGGTALWLSKHLSTHEFQNELLITTDNEFSDQLLLSELEELENVSFAAADVNDLQQFDDLSIDCVVLGCKANLIERFNLVQSTPRLKRKPIIAYDPNRLLANESKGSSRYFMNSSIWVRDGY